MLRGPRGYRRFSVSSTESAGVIGENGVEVEVLMIQTRQCRVYLVMTSVAVEFSGDAAGKTTTESNAKFSRASRGEEEK